MGFVRTLKISQGIRIDTPSGRIEVVVRNIWWDNYRKNARVEIKDGRSGEAVLTEGREPYQILDGVRISLGPRQRGGRYARIYLDVPETYNVGHF